MSHWKRPQRVVGCATEDQLKRARSAFYGIPSELIATWLVCSLDRAERIKDGRSRPSAAELKLYQLHLSERVLDDRWTGWSVRRGLLVDPDGNECTKGMLQAYSLIVQLCRRLAYESADASMLAQFEEAMRKSA